MTDEWDNEGGAIPHIKLADVQDERGMCEKSLCFRPARSCERCQLEDAAHRAEKDCGWRLEDYDEGMNLNTVVTVLLIILLVLAIAWFI